MRLLVLGARGFIGANVCRILASRATILRADIDRDTADDYLQIDPDHPDFLWLVERASPDVIVNCTGAASVPASFEAPYRDYTLNALRMLQLLEAIRVSKRSIRTVHLSSAAVYGNPERIPVQESARIAPLSPYGWHKRQAELFCEEYSRLYGVETISLRIFSAYGPGLRKQLFWDVYQKALRAPRLEMFGTGEETRDFIFIEDLVAAIDLLLRKGSFDGRAVNVASGRAVTTRDAVHTLVSALGLQREIVFSGAGRRGDPERWEADLSYLGGLGFVPAHDIQSGLAKTARWLTEQE